MPNLENIPQNSLFHHIKTFFWKFVFPKILIFIFRIIFLPILPPDYGSDLKVSSLYNIGHNKCKELLPTKLQFKVNKNLTWHGSWILLDVLSPVKKSLLPHPWRMLWHLVHIVPHVYLLSTLLHFRWKMCILLASFLD
jgi:hypothetical protein